jgi:predicted metal-dependent hydrolase
MSGTRPVLLAAAREFNSGRFFEAHEILEEGLEEVDEGHWDLALGLIQIAVGYHKASQGLASGAVLMLGKGLEKVSPFPAEVATLQLEPLRRRVAADIDRLRRGEPADAPRMQLRPEEQR